MVLHQVEDVGYRLRRRCLYARSVTLKLRYPDFTTITRSGSLAEPSHLTDTLWRCAIGLFDAWRRERPGALRLIGTTAAGLSGEGEVQPSLFDPDEKSRKLDTALDRIRERFGSEAVRRRKK